MSYQKELCRKSKEASKGYKTQESEPGVEWLDIWGCCIEIYF